MADAQLYHPKTKDLYTAPSEAAAEVLKKSGWTTEIPKEKKEA
jgi:hypothetical protein